MDPEDMNKEEKKEEVKEPFKQEKEHKEKRNVTKKIRENPWIISTVVLAVLALLLLIFNFFSGGIAGNVVSEDKAGEAWVNYLESLDYEAEIVDVESVSGVYAITFEYDDGQDLVYLTSDAKNYIYGLVPISGDEEEEEESEVEVQEIVQSDKPLVELFVMSYCPYGTQAEKGILPVAELLGDKIDFRIRYVYYLMHGEKEAEENLREYCIQEISPEKYLDYMNCFLEGDGVVSSSGYITNGNDVNTCLSEAGIDTTQLNSCIAEADEEFSVTENLEDESSWLNGYYPLFDVDKDLNEQYSISGSPTLVINGVMVSSSRSPSAYLDAICQAFTDESVPEECKTELSSETPSAYFGWDNTGSSTTATCE